VITEGFFTQDETNAARQYGAGIQKLKSGRLQLSFPDSEKYESWAREQQKLHPKRWAHSMKVAAKD
jgi:hypothetical protein